MNPMPSTTFSLRQYLRADLLRYRFLVTGVQVNASPGLWLHMLSPRFAPVLLCRCAFRLQSWHLGPLAKIVSLLNFVVFGIEISPRCPIGKGVFFPHTQGTVIGAKSVGENATIFQGVTLGAKELDIGYSEDARPVLGDDVIVGAGAKLLGGISIGHRARVGANAVVVESVPEGALAVGVPAKVVVPRDVENV
ncbi:serine O-acetyltransferase [Pandoraea sputorum]